MTTTQQNVPVLRFKDEQGKDYQDWEEKKLENIGKFKSGIGFPHREQSGIEGIPFYKVSDMNLQGNESEMKTSNNYVSHEQIKRLKYKPIKEISIIFAKVGAAIFLERKRIAQHFLIDNNMMAFVPTINLLLVKCVFDNMILSKYAQTGALPYYNQSDLESIKVAIPKNYNERERIAAFLSSVDTKIEQLNRKKALLEQNKKGMMQKLFSQEIRFKDEQGKDYPDWVGKQLSEIFERVTSKNKVNNKNVLTISAQKGLVNQTEYFNHQVAAKDLTGYYLLRKGDFAYNKSYSKGYPMIGLRKLVHRES